jgi:glycogenin glucosyltransferase
MWYQVPESKPEPEAKPKPIFPWEQEPDRPKATRVFAEDLPPPAPAPAPEPTIAAPTPTNPFSTVHYSEEGGSSSDDVTAAGPTSPPRVSSPKTADEQWQEFQQSSVNAWDSVPGIDTYVRAIMEAQVRRAKGQPLSPSGGAEEILSPSISRKDRRESLIITDFPSAVERPSLPVTPAPIRRPTFWGEERDDAGDLPQAEGVPDQNEWVCPQCGFSSVRAEDFRGLPRESPIASTTAAFATPSPSASFTPAFQTPPKEDVPSTPSTPVTPTLRADSPVENVVIPLEEQYKSGVSARGAPLASLTDPSLLDRPTHVTDISTPSSASNVQPTITSPA